MTPLEPGDATEKFQGEHMKDSLSHITIILDRSGSMESVREATITGFNEFVDGQKAAPGDATITLVKFDSENAYEVVFDTKPIKECPKLTNELFVPRASTPLHDAIGRGIVALGSQLKRMPEAERPGKVFMVIVTDGLENASKEYTSPQLAEMIKHQSDVYKWQFIFIGANQDAIMTGERLNIPRGQTISYAASAAGSYNVTRSLGNVINEVRSGLRPSATFSVQDREDAMEEDKKTAKQKK